jgi:hypothetical protein
MDRSPDTGYHKERQLDMSVDGQISRVDRLANEHVRKLTGQHTDRSADEPAKDRLSE